MNFLLRWLSTFDPLVRFRKANRLDISLFEARESGSTYVMEVRLDIAYDWVTDGQIRVLPLPETLRVIIKNATYLIQVEYLDVKKELGICGGIVLWPDADTRTVTKKLQELKERNVQFPDSRYGTFDLFSDE